MNCIKHKISEIEVDGLRAELSVEPSFIMDYIEHKVERAGDLVIVGYLVDDHDVQNPLEDCDGMGSIFTSHRHYGRHREMQKALGLDSEWKLDLYLDSVMQEAHRELMHMMRTEYQPDFVAFIMECAHDLDLSRDEAIEYFVQDFTGQHPYQEASWLTGKVNETIDWEILLTNAWRICRRVGKAGDPYAVPLDCYEHGGQVWSLSGTGTQCLFDTARGAGVWVPDDVLRGELDEIRRMNGLDAARAKCAEFARQALESYNAWLSGDCYGIAVDVFVLEGDCLKRIDESAVWGFVGSKWAEAAMSDEVMTIAASHVPMAKAA